MAERPSSQRVMRCHSQRNHARSLGPFAQRAAPKLLSFFAGVSALDMDTDEGAPLESAPAEAVAIDEEDFAFAFVEAAAPTAVSLVKKGDSRAATLICKLLFKCCMVFAHVAGDVASSTGDGDVMMALTAIT